MSLPLRKRTVHFYEVQCYSYSRRTDIKNPTCAKLEELLTCFSKMARPSSLPLTIKKQAHVRTVLNDWRFDKLTGCYELLISKANAALSDVAFRDLSTTNLRKAGKTKTEGIEVSAHALLRPSSDGQTALLLLTMGAGVTAADVSRLLRLLSREASKYPRNSHLFNFDDPSGAKDENGETIKYKVHYKFEVLGYKGQTLTHALETGNFESMDLIARVQENFDAGGNFRVAERVLGVRAKLPKNVTAASVVNAVRRFLKQPDTNIYDKLRIRYKTETGESTGTTLDIQDLDSAFTLKEIIHFDSDVDSQQERLDPLVLTRMRTLLQSVS